VKLSERMGAFVVWALLCGLTLISLAVTEGPYRRVASIAVVLLAAAKVRLVIIHYMEVRRAAKHWRVLYQAWIFAVSAAIVIAYVIGLNSPTD